MRKLNMSLAIFAGNRIPKSISPLTRGFGVILFAAGAVSISGVSYATIYEIDPAHANVRFAIDHFGTSTNTGGFYNLTGEVLYDPSAKKGRVFFEIPMETINTGNHEFDSHLKGDDFFNVEAYPTAKFVSTKWHFKNSEADSINEQGLHQVDEAAQQRNTAVTHVDGLLTLHGKTHPVTLTATKFNCYFSPVIIKSVCGGDFRTTIDRTKWGIDKYVLFGMAKNVTLYIQIEAIKK